MVNPEVIRSALGIIGNATSFFLFASPIPTVWRFLSKKTVEEFKFHPYVAGLMNCVMWVFYSMPFVHPHSILVTTVNGTGFFMYIFYFVTYWIYTDNKRRKWMALYVMGEVVFLAGLGCITLLVFHTHPARSAFVGIFCDIFGIILYSSPLTIMIKVIKTKSVEFMPLPLSLTGFANGVVWSAYALIKFDLYILLGNGIGAIISALQIILYAFFYSFTPKKQDNEVPEAEKPSQIQLSTDPYAEFTAV